MAVLVRPTVLNRSQDWTVQHYPGPKGLPFIGNVLQVWPNRRRMIKWMEEQTCVFGPLFTFTIPSWGRTIVINRPEWLAHVKKNDLVGYTRGSVAVDVFRQFPGVKTPVASEGAEWRHARKTIQPIFAHKNFHNNVMSAMNEIVITTRKLLDKAADERLVFDFHNLTGRIALAIFCKSTFSFDAKVLREDTSCLTEPDSFIALNKLSTISSERRIQELWKIIDELVEWGTQPNDAKASNEETDFMTSFLQNPASQDKLFVRNIMLTMLFAGRDNTSSSLAWSLYETSRRPEWLRRMREEAIALGTAGQMPNYATINAYAVHLAVFYETVRLWPGLPKNARYAIQDDVLPAIPEQGLPEVRVEKGSYVLWSDRLIMRDKTVWGSDADIFNPARHLTPDGKLIKPSGQDFVTFGAGPRYCPAAQLVPYQWVSIWSGLLPYFDFEAVGTQEMQAAENLTTAMTSPFFVRARRLDPNDV
ncbi:hypothetical protein EIP86_007266 [Pleurotus ostreatoroseus]|nr:hypothetical protein EIP86_007266 [Pleurotus ostreatoroseus]